MKLYYPWLITAIPAGLLLGCVAKDGDRTTPTSTSCDVAAFSSALSSAKEGATVEIGQCIYEGSFTVPAGVTLKGDEKGGSKIIGSPDLPAIRLVAGAATPTALLHVDIESNGTAGVIAEGEGEYTILDVDVTAARGIGVGAEGVTRLELSGVRLVGPVTMDNAGEIPEDATPKDTATHGLVLVKVADATLTDVSASGFAQHGALLVDTAVTWTGGGASDNRGNGLMIVGGQATLDDLELSRTLKGGGALPAYGAVFTSAKVVLEDEAQPAQEGASVTATNLKVEENANVGLLYADGASFQLDDSTVAKNAFAGVLIADSSNIAMKGTRIEKTLEQTLPLGEQDLQITLGDGVHVVRSKGIHFTDVVLEDNARAGLQLDVGDLAAGDAELMWENVEANPTQNTSYGALCQGGLAGVPAVFEAATGDPLRWDGGILRNAIAVANDPLVSSPIDVVGLVGPCNAPAPVTVVLQGIAALIGK